MFSKATFFIAFVAIAKLSVAAVPGCLLGAINQYDNPADIKAVCQSKDAQAKIQTFCGDSTADALSAFADVCNNAGVKVSTVITQSGTVSPTASAKPSGTGNAAATTGGAAATTGTQTGAVAKSTGAAGKLEAGVAAVFAGFGLLAVAL